MAEATRKWALARTSILQISQVESRSLSFDPRRHFQKVQKLLLTRREPFAILCP
jgi:hypothetical protein